MRARAFAKVNLTLEVTGKRPDGYHELISIMQTVDLADQLELLPDDSLTLNCNRPELLTDENLVLKAARVLRRGGRFRLHKNVPLAGGLGGGSSDAAAALRLMNAVYELGLSQPELVDAAARVGSDVPFFLTSGTALVEGRGERVTALPDLPEQWLVLLNPGIPLSTPAVFRELRPSEYATGAATRSYLEQIPPLPERGRQITPLPPLINTLEAPAGRLEERVRQGRVQLMAAGASSVLLSGSGPTLFAPVGSEWEATAIASRTGGIAARFVNRDDALRLES